MTTFNLSNISDPNGDCFVLVHMEITPSNETDGEIEEEFEMEGKLTEGIFSKLVNAALKSFMGTYGTGVPIDIINFYTESGSGIIKVRHGLVPMLRAALTLSTSARFTVLRYSPSLMSLAIDMN